MSTDANTRLNGMAAIDIADENLMKLNGLQRVISVEEGIETSVDEALARVLEFYGRFVPYGKVSL